MGWGLAGEYIYRRQWDSSDILDARALPSLKGILHWTGRINGVANQYKPETFATITDGTSNTLMVGEYTTKTSPRRTTFWAYSYTSFALSCATPESRTLIPDYDKCVSQGDSNPCKRAFAGFHTGIVQFVKADGSVNPVSTSLDMKVYMALSTIAGGEVASDQ